VLTVYEVYIDAMRTADSVHHLVPSIETLEEIALIMEMYTMSVDKMPHATQLCVATKTFAKAWAPEPADGRFDRGWDLRGPRRYALDRRLMDHLSFIDKRRVGLLPNRSTAPRVWAKAVWHTFPPQVRRHPAFYSALVGLYLAVLIPFLMGINQRSWRGLFGTFLPVPPQYCIDCLSGGEGVPIQKALVPLVYGFMHMAMLSLCLLPLPLCRGMLRDLRADGPNSRGIVPVEDALWLHKLFGVLFLTFLILGPFLWLIAMGSTCLGTSTDEQVAIVKACSAFNPFVFDAKAGPIPPANNVSQHVIMTDLVFDSFEGASFFDPRDNVLFLRAVAWPLLFGITPWIARRDSPPSWMPSMVVRNWFEIVTYAHYASAWAVIAMAVYARFEVFFFVIIGFGLLLIEKAREWTLHSYRVAILFGKGATDTSYTLLHRSSVNNQPTAVEIVMKRPQGFKFTAGQYLYVKVPAIDSVWHAFSLASCPSDESIHLHMGVIGGKQGNWIQPTDADAEFKQRHPTWTYHLFAMIRHRFTTDDDDAEPLAAVVRGPYGPRFQSCFTRRYKACVLVGSGTGLTSALSVLKEVIERRRNDQVTTDKVWFVWSCRNVRDLLWCWRTLQQAIVEACRTGAIDVPEGWSAATSTSLDWLGVSIFVSQSNKDELLSFLGYSDTFVAQFDHHATEAVLDIPPPVPPRRKLKMPATKSIRHRHHPAPPLYDNPMPDDDHEDFYVVSRQDNDDIYVSSQQRDVLHACTPEVKTVLKRVATYRARCAVREMVPVTDTLETQLDELVNEFVASGGTQNRNAEEKLLADLLERSKGRQMLDIGAWLKEQVIATSMDTNGAHIGDLLCDLTAEADGGGVAMCYCGSNTLAQSLSTLCSDMDIPIEYMAHNE
jgi:NAD(P)H-flavin reductase